MSTYVLASYPLCARRIAASRFDALSVSRGLATYDGDGCTTKAAKALQRWRKFSFHKSCALHDVLLNLAQSSEQIADAHEAFRCSMLAQAREYGRRELALYAWAWWAAASIYSLAGEVVAR